MAKRGLGKGLRAYFPDYQEEHLPSETEQGTGTRDEGESHREAERPADKKAKLQEMDMVLPGSTRKTKSAETTKQGRSSDKEEIKKTEKRTEKKQIEKSVAKTADRRNQKTADGKGEKDSEARETLLKISQIEPNQEQPRKYFNEEQLKELAESVKNYGVLQPLLVQKRGDFYEIIAGERRWRAAKLAGLKEVPVLIRDYTKQQTVEIALIENVQRADLNPIEEARAYQMLVQEFGLKQEEVADRVSKNRATITNSMRLLKLDERVQRMLVENQLSGGHARALLGLEDGDQQYALAQKAAENQLSVREVERLVKLMTAPKKKKPEDTERDLSFIYRDLEEKLKSVMGTKVTINKKDKNKGRIEIEYYSQAELERIVDLIQSIHE